MYASTLMLLTSLRYGTYTWSYKSFLLSSSIFACSISTLSKLINLLVVATTRVYDVTIVRSRLSTIFSDHGGT